MSKYEEVYLNIGNGSLMSNISIPDLMMKYSSYVNLYVGNANSYKYNYR